MGQGVVRGSLIWRGDVYSFHASPMIVSLRGPVRKKGKDTTMCTSSKAITPLC